MKMCRKSAIGVIAIIVSLAIMDGPLCRSVCAQDAAGTSTSERAPAPLGNVNKLALLVGINNYRYVNPLKGAVNDVENMKQLLVGKFGFPDDQKHILVLKNEEATHDGIIRAIKGHLIAKANRDSIVIFHYSGHGSQKVDDNGDEIDGYDETLVTYDSGHQDPYPNRDITDDEIYELLNQLTEKTPNVTFIFDSCHSGTVARGAGIARTVERDNRAPAGQGPAPTAAARGVDEGKSGMRPANARYAVISGSKTDEYSYETEENGQPHGALTWYLADQIRQGGPNATYRDIMDLVKTRVSAKYPSQHPQLEGPGEDQLVFSDKSQGSTPYVLAKLESGGTVALEAGQVQGVTIGSLYDVYSPGIKSFGPEIKPVARVEVTAVDLTSSTARVREGKLEALAYRAVEREHHWPSPVIRVYFKGLEKSETLKKIKANVREFKHITPVETENGYDLLLQEYKDKKDGESYIVTEGGDPTEISPRVAVTDPDAVSHVVKQVTDWAKWFNILRIENVQPDLRVEFELNKPEAAATGPRSLADQEVNLTLQVGDTFTIKVTNKSQRDLYIALLDLSNDGSVGLVYPKRGQEFLAPDKTLSMTLRTTLPAGRDSVRDVLKLIATPSYADFSFLGQAAVRGGPMLSNTRGKPANPLEELLANAAMGATRGVESVEVKSWVTIDRVLDVRRKK